MITTNVLVEYFWKKHLKQSMNSEVIHRGREVYHKHIESGILTNKGGIIIGRASDGVEVTIGSVLDSTYSVYSYLADNPEPKDW